MFCGFFHLTPLSYSPVPTTVDKRSIVCQVRRRAPPLLLCQQSHSRSEAIRRFVELG